jgi:predicted DNA-binding transcriptional regulator AlpA
MQNTSQMPALLSAQQLADLLGCSLQTIYNWRVQDKGPKGLRLGGNGDLRYFLTDVHGWLEADRDQQAETRLR